MMKFKENITIAKSIPLNFKGALPYGTFMELQNGPK